MADIANLGFRVDTSDLERANRELSRLGRQGGDTEQRLTRSTSATAGAFRAFGGDIAAVGGAASKAKDQLLALAGVVSLVGAGSNIIEMADEYKNLDAKLHLVTKSQTEFLDVQSKLSAMADANRQSLSATISRKSGIAPSLQKAGQSQTNILKAVDSVNKALVVGGSNAQGSAASILQLTQALGSGVLRGDEFNSIMENGRGIAMMLADALHTDTGKLRGLAEQGKLTAEIVTAALIEQNSAVSEKFAKMPVTVGQAIQVVKNNLLTYVGGADSASGATSALSDALISLSGNISTVANVVGVIATIYAGRGLAALTGYTAAKMAAVAAGRAKIATDAQEAVATATQSAATSRAAVVQRQATVVNASMSAQAALANKEAASTALLAARGTDGYAAAVQRMQAAHVRSTTASAAAALARTEYTAATHAAATAEIRLAATQASAARATGVMAAAMRGLSGAMALVGGPVGLLVVAIAGLAYGLKNLVDEEEKAKDAIKDSSGEWLKYADITDKAKQLNVEYTTASKSKKKAIEDELKALNAATEAEIKSAAATLGATQAKLAALKISNQKEGYAPAYVDDQGNLVSDSIDAGKALESSYQRDIDQQIVKLNELNAGLQGVTHEQKNLGKATDDTSTKTGESALSLLGAGKASKEAAKVLHEHGDALKSLIEGLAKQRIELEHGKLAAEYYTNRLNGLTDAEARAAAGAGQYNTYLAERKKLQQEAAALSGDVAAAYLAELDTAGLSEAALSGIDDAKAATDQAVKASTQYQSSIDATTEALKRQAEAAKAAGAGAVSSFAAQSAGIQQIAGQAAASAAQVVGKLQALGWSKNQAVGIAANLKQESEFRANAVGDSGNAYGIAQWHGDRQANFSRAMGKSIQGSSVDDQLRFVTYELTKGSEKGAGNRLKNASSAAEAAAIISRYYERPAATAEEMTRRAGIANGIAKSLGDAVPTFRSVADESAKLAPAAAKAVPIWDDLNASAAATKDVTIEYGGAIDGARVTSDQLNGLLQDKLNNTMNGLLKTAKDQTQEAALTGEQYRQQQLAAMHIGEERAKAVMIEEQLANYTQERGKLEQDNYNALNGMAAQYSHELEKQNLSQKQISDLLARKMQGATDKILHDMTQQTLQLRMSADQWRRLELSQDGYNAAQIASIVKAEKLLATTKQIRDAADRVGEGLLDGLMKAASGTDGVVASLKSTVENAFADMVLRPTLQPITNAVSAGINGTLTGQANPWAGLQQAYSHTMKSMQAGGWQGAATTAGVAATVSALFGGSQAEQTGAAIGGAIGNSLGGPVGGAIGSVLGNLAGGLFKDDDSARAKFVSSAKAASGLDGWYQQQSVKTSAFGQFGFVAHGTHDLGTEVDKQLAALTDKMAAIDNAIAKFMPASEIDRVKQALTDYQHTGLDFEGIVKDRIKIISTGLSAGFQSLIDFGGTADDVVARLDELLTIQQDVIPVLARLNLQMGNTSDSALIAAAGLADAAGSLANLTSVTDAYYQFAYSETERLSLAKTAAQATVDAFNAAHNAQINGAESLRAYVEALDLSNAANQKAAIDAMGLTDELKTLATQAESAANANSDLVASAPYRAGQSADNVYFADFGKNQQPIVVNVDTESMAAQIESLKAEIAALRSEQYVSNQQAAMQRETAMQKTDSNSQDATRAARLVAA